MRLPLLASLPELADDGRPPQISRVEVEEVSLGVFVSVHISWETDEFADSSVLFGVGKLTEKSSSDFNLRKDHEMILSGLKKGKEYLFSAVSEDVFGNRAVSAPLTFSTHRDLLAKENPSDPYLPDSDNPDLTQRLRRAGDQYLLEVSARYPVVVSLGKNSENRNGPHRLAQVPVSLNDSPHPPMQGEEVLNIHICFECHQNINEAMSHPVNILPPKGMIIPPEYPLLADGRMTCMSCHRRHGSDLPFRMIKSSRKELCIGCHVNY
ncbi:MAG: cytochrome c3 family protein [Desulfuromonadales bacterium]